MRISSRCLVVGVLSYLAFPQTSWAQSTDVSLGASALMSIQPVADENVGGGPYFSGPGFGGVGPGLSVALNIVTERRLSVTVEFSTAKFEERRSGRLVGGQCPAGVPPNECPYVGGTDTLELNDSMLGALVGRAHGTGRTQVHVLGGAYWLIAPPTVSSLEGDSLPIAPALGFDVVHRLGTSASLVVGARYAIIFNDLRTRYYGISPHVLRAGVGLRFRFS